MTYSEKFALNDNLALIRNSDNVATDLNDSEIGKTVGWSKNTLNAPIFGYGIAWKYAYTHGGNSWIWQIALCTDTMNHYIRSNIANNGWSGWNTCLVDADINVISNETLTSDYCTINQCQKLKIGRLISYQANITITKNVPVNTVFLSGFIRPIISYSPTTLLLPYSYVNSIPVSMKSSINSGELVSNNKEIITGTYVFSITYITA